MPTRRIHLFTLLVLLSMVASCARERTGGHQPGGEAGALGVSVERADFREEILLTGELRAVRATSIIAPETSIFQMRIQFLPEEGTEVAAGDTLVLFDNTALAERVLDLETRILDAETRIAARRSELVTALMDLELERTQRRYDRDRSNVRADIEPSILSRKDYAERRFELDKATRELDEVLDRIERTGERGRAEVDVLVIEKEKLERDLVSTRQDLEVLDVKAPIDGLVVYEYRRGAQDKLKEGDSVWPGQPIVTLPDLSEMEVQFQVSEVDAHRLEIGMPVQITVDSFPDRLLDGEIVEIPSMAVSRAGGSNVRIFRVRCTLSETIAGIMKPGMSVMGRVTVNERPGVMVVPRAAVVHEAGEYRLVPSPGDPSADARAIRPIARNATHYVLEDAGESRESVSASRSGPSPAEPIEPVAPAMGTVTAESGPS